MFCFFADPHIKVIGLPEDVRVAKDLIMAVLDTKSNRATLKMDVSHTDHSHVIGKGGNNIKRVMQETGCHVHFPDSNRGNNVQEKSNQVSIAGQPQGVEAARAKIRELLPLVFMFELPVTTIPIQIPDLQSPAMQQLQQQYNVNVSFRQRQRGYGTTVIVRGSVYNEKLVKEATLKMMDLLLGKLPSPLPINMQLEIAPQHHLFIIGRGGMNIKQIMQATGAMIHFPDPNSVTPQRKGTVYITGTIDSVFLARQQLIGCLPLVLMFDVKEELEMDPGRVTQLMEHLDVFISVKPKPKQPSKSVIVKSIERNSSNMYLARLLLLGIEKKLPQQPVHQMTEEGTPSNVLSLTALGYFGHNVPQNIQQTLQINTANQLLLVNGQKSPPTTANTMSPKSPRSPNMNTSSPNHYVSPPPGIYAPMMVVRPAVSVQNVVDLMNHCNINGIQKDVSQNAGFQQTTQTLNVTDHVGRNRSEASSPSRSPCESPSSFRENTSAVDLAGLSTSNGFGNIVTSPRPNSTLTSSGHTLDLLGLSKPKVPLSSSAHTMDLLGLSKTTNPMNEISFLNSGLSNGSLHGSLNSASLHASLNNASLHGSMNNMNSASLHSSMNNGSLHGSLNSASLRASLTRSHLTNGDGRLHEDLRAPGIERKNSTSNHFADTFQPFGVDYEQKKLLANKAIQKKPIGESRTPTDFWSGLGFSKSMPESAIRERMQQTGVRQKYEPPMATTYENTAEEMSEMDRDPWRDSTTMYNRPPINPAPGEYPSPRKKWPEYGLSASNHIDGALVPSKSYWSPKLDLAELFIKLGLGKYTDLFQQQEIDLPTFLTLTDHDLRELGISTFGARKKMLLAIADLNKRRMLMSANSPLEDSDPFHEAASSPHGSHPDIASLSGRW
ncbi:protein bicaudal C homolog 1-B-like [Ruditapes philippinarum]|uniref:protein bicaudal C homolog 1-B-like n=1 Tax=Ruditapes philippinarum TaxID=129788 RepID=UPI00295AE2D6|nr:protein bicaudal C homolog 1-B-like [Ruditapes philippinarum]